MDIVALVSGVLGVIGVVGGAAFYLKYIATKANLDGKDETISTLERQRDATKEENVTLRNELGELRGENRTLRDIATQTPEIIKLTEAVTLLTQNFSKQSEQTAELLGQVVQAIRDGEPLPHPTGGKKR